ncbi:AraC family transcriptional regulator [Desulfonema ishimotonii]|uniref:AraC family transcriptional regulator n=1 Tax=Desulfonema ishimotonii TaxID=45657 RepID=A0A401FVV3_9BACT|nr:AraC family transcriptional regulator [Desulfonema ishimotonii]GBC61088.1 AraC family transcriptional regulator [Desulfonema ishimotonii]
MEKAITENQACFWKARQMDGVYLFKARFRDFVYARHTHNEFAIGVIERGTQRFHHRGGTHLAPARAIITVNPDEVHDGEAAATAGYQYRMSYIRPDIVTEILAGFDGPACPAGCFRTPVTFDAEISGRLHRAFLMLENEQNSRLESQSLFIDAITDLFRRHASPRLPESQIRRDRTLVRKACEFIRATATENISLEEIARVAGLSRFHFLRMFKATTGLPPHAYLIQQRVEIARRAIEQGSPIADAALRAGFSDQSHLNRRFKAIHGITPGQYQKAIRF